MANKKKPIKKKIVKTTGGPSKLADLLSSGMFGLVGNVFGSAMPNKPEKKITKYKR